MSISEKDLLHKFQKLIQMSERIKITDVLNSLKITRAEMFEHFIKWHENLPFKVDGEFIVVENMNSFIHSLDIQFELWEKQEQNKLAKEAKEAKESKEDEADIEDKKDLNNFISLENTDPKKISADSVASYRPLTPGENLEITRIIQNPLYLSEILSDPLKGINYLENLHEGLTNVDQTATVLLTRAFILIHFGKYEKSTRLFKLISQIYPDYKLYLAGLGYVEFLNENYTKAHLLFEQAYAHLKRNLFINYNLARLKYLRGEYVLAQKLLNKGLKLAPESTLFTNFLNFIAQRQNGKQINASPNQIRIKITVFFCENSALFWVVPLVLTAIMGILGIRGAMQNNLSITVYCFISVIINSFIIVTYLKPFFSHYIMNDEWDVIIDDVFMLNRKNSISKWLIYGTVMTLTTFGLAGPLFLIVLYLFFPQYRFLFNNKK